MKPQINFEDELKKALAAERIEDQKRFNYYSKLLDWVLEQKKEKPIFIGISAPQGAGKTTISRIFVSVLKELGFNAEALSIDDFYLTRVQQVSIAQQFLHNPYLQSRGYPGTHDVTLGVEILKSLRNIKSEERCQIPRYEKSAHGGKGDRLPQDLWSEVAGPLDFVFFEGWMLGFQPLKDNLPDARLEPVDAFLERYSEWTDLLDAFIHLKPKEVRQIPEWRIEAEEKMKAQGKPGLPLEEIRKYAELFVPAYEAYLPGLSSHAIKPGATLRWTLGADRLPIEVEPLLF